MRRGCVVSKLAVVLGLTVVGSCMVDVADAGAQVGGRGRRQSSSDPSYWVGLSIGYVEGMTTSDNKSDATWQFGYTSQIRATLEKALQPGVTLGISAGFSNPPLTYNGSGFDANCPGSCHAHADVSQYLAFVNVGGRPTYGFHGGFTLEGGVTQFSNFRDDITDARLATASSSYDFTFGVGGGPGYNLSSSMDLYAVAGWDMILHPQSSTVTAQRPPQMTTFNVGVRVGF